MALRNDLSQLVVVITGASSGLGAATATALARHGTSLVLAARGRSALDDVAKQCRSHGADVVAVPADTAKQTDMTELARRATETFGRIDAWINNAAVTVFGDLLDLPMADVRRVLDVNLLGYLHGARAAVPQLRAGGGGVLIFVGSVLGEACAPGQGPYNMAKHGLVGLATTLRQELRQQSGPVVEVCSVLPASIDTPLFSHCGNRTDRVPRPLPPLNSPDRIAARVIGLLTSPRRRIYAGLGGRTTGMAARHLPGITERLLGRYARRYQFVAGETTTPSPGNLSHSANGGTVQISGGWRQVAPAAAVTATAAGLFALYRLLRSRTCQ
jgi:NAD(P)-dependent dehydrogenase (short-subunit alcohol dehydrogenase family)